ncbi:hypothetical protein [Herbaspirillum frisingense]|uniref:hypothetical protein n=1 Tax=Herbaspirillum frisingense TaxID=92645 RepID=UPI001F30115A|nr:hypothetical protein [Herbaspirillum frisingense]UIN23508.1 hypothetical protein LAZ82_10600 [Herbaspirillum frisingense]
MTISAIILTHPKFDRPKVKNAVHRGRKPKCCLNFIEAKRQRATIEVYAFYGLGPDGKPLPSQSAPLWDTHTAPRTACAQLQQFEALFRTADEKGATLMSNFLGAILTTEIKRRLREGRGDEQP